MILCTHKHTQNVYGYTRGIYMSVQANTPGSDNKSANDLIICATSDALAYVHHGRACIYVWHAARMCVPRAYSTQGVYTCARPRSRVVRVKTVCHYDTNAACARVCRYLRTRASSKPSAKSRARANGWVTGARARQVRTL